MSKLVPLIPPWVLPSNQAELISSVVLRSLPSKQWRIYYQAPNWYHWFQARILITFLIKGVVSVSISQSLVLLELVLLVSSITCSLPSTDELMISSVSMPQSCLPFELIAFTYMMIVVRNFAIFMLLVYCLFWLLM